MRTEKLAETAAEFDTVQTSNEHNGWGQCTTSRIIPADDLRSELIASVLRGMHDERPPLG